MTGGTETGGEDVTYKSASKRRKGGSEVHVSEVDGDVSSWRPVHMKPKLESQPDTIFQIRRPSPGQGQIEQRHQRTKLVDVLKVQFIVS